MAELTVDMTYGAALYGAAKELDKVHVILEEGKALLDIFKSEPSFYQIINNPTIPPGEKKEMLGKVFHGKLCQEIMNFLYVLIDKRRTGNYETIMREYESLVNKGEGIVKGEIYSVEPLNNEQLKGFCLEISDLLKKKVVLENKIDTGLIGGVKVLVNGKIIDASIKKRLKDLMNVIK